MRKDILALIQSNRDLHRFIREQPQWYRTLSRDPQSITQFQKAARQYYKKTFANRVQKITEGAQMASFMLNMLQAVEKGDE
ncbi:YlbE-like family protein [Fervidibacillus halotolerans]|uniref:YlbE-like family protein n=1 Tax=Fervidibacillus halotolerans TaxID=2980027 RepID=A0A9E8RYD8_9BACI|nr:YlbE-like family protein [Fervidibacillus halotolerans]WAA13710.1 YlbE-like family protein [Fervidibacillus halotolerans]